MRNGVPLMPSRGNRKGVMPQYSEESPRQLGIIPAAEQCFRNTMESLATDASSQHLGSYWSDSGFSCCAVGPVGHRPTSKLPEPNSQFGGVTPGSLRLVTRVDLCFFL